MKKEELSQDERIAQASDKAIQAYWDVISKEFPEIKTGFLSFEKTYQLKTVSEEVIEEWLEFNSQRRRYEK